MAAFVFTSVMQISSHSTTGCSWKLLNSTVKWWMM